MNYVNGKIITEAECQPILENIDQMILSTLAKPPLDINQLIDACDTLVKNIHNLDAIKRLPELGISSTLMEIYQSQVEQMFSGQAICKRLETELGQHYNRPKEIIYTYSKAKAAQIYAPLGVLFHITAGNVDVLPFISLLEGLVCGNINIIKLPKEDMGITISLLDELINILPALKEYAYVFDYSSRDIYAMKKLAAVSDAIVVWGSDEAVKAVRTLADPNTKIIEWGHKISFAYVTMEGINKAISLEHSFDRAKKPECKCVNDYKENEDVNNQPPTSETNIKPMHRRNTLEKLARTTLEKLALNICLTNQLFCSSCQGIFLDTDDMQDVYDFCQVFLPVLERVSQENPFAFDEGTKLFTQARVTLELYHKEIENRGNANRIFKGKNCSITACTDSNLEPSIMYRNIWVKPLKKDKLLNLRRYKNYLQTAALICSEAEHDELSGKLLQAGVVKISDGFEMSNYAFGEAHDGVFAFRCYTKLVSVQDRCKLD